MGIWKLETTMQEKPDNQVDCMKWGDVLTAFRYYFYILNFSISTVIKNSS